MNKKYMLIAFLLLALVQVYVPANMIFERENILRSGKDFKFIVQPIDPNDPFRGKYITLVYKENSIRVQGGNDWSNDEDVYVLLKTDKNGFASINAISDSKPTNTDDFVKAKIDFVRSYDSTVVFIEYPFERFYMEESKAPVAEQIYNESVTDSSKTSWALVSVKNGEAVLKDVLIDGVSIVQMVRERNRKNQ